MTTAPEPESNRAPEAIVGGSRRMRGRVPLVRDRNFRRPTPPSRAQQSELTALSARCGQWIQTYLSNAMRRLIPVEPEAVEALPYDLAASQLPEDSWVVPLTGPGAHRAVVHVDRDAQEWMLLSALGGPPPAPPVGENGPELPPPPPIGPVSRRALRPLLDGLLRERGFVQLAGEENGFTIDDERERTPRARLLRPSDSVTSFAYSVHVGPEHAVKIGFLFLQSTIAPHLSAPERERRAEPDPSMKKRLESTVRGLSTDAAVVLGGARIDLAEFLKLEPGDVLVLDRRIGEPLEISVGGRPLFVGHPGRSCGKLAVRVSGRNETRSET